MNASTFWSVSAWGIQACYFGQEDTGGKLVPQIFPKRVYLMGPKTEKSSSLGLLSTHLSWDRQQSRLQAPCVGITSLSSPLWPWSSPHEFSTLHFMNTPSSLSCKRVDSLKPDLSCWRVMLILAFLQPLRRNSLLYTAMIHIHDRAMSFLL